jgi:hypothetical protein
MEEIATKFYRLFGGSNRAHGIFEIDALSTDVKQKGKAKTVRSGGAEHKHWIGHLNGEYGLGIIPITKKNQVSWGCIDIDTYPLDIPHIVNLVEYQKFPLVVCRSKSGGAHVFLFTNELVPAGDMQDKLRELSAALGHGGVEIYPKQREILVDRNDVGSWLNMPYFGGDGSTRYGLNHKGDSLSMVDFLDFVESRKISRKQLVDIKVPEVKDIDGGPPCLKVLLKQGFPEGTRNNGLFNVGVYLKKAFADEWEQKIEDYNRKYVNPPLPAQEVLGLIKTLQKKEYNYRCSDEPIRSYCNRSKCLSCKHGVGGNQGSPTFSSLAKLDTDPPLWFLSVSDRRLELTTEQLQNQMRFQRVCMEQLNMMPPRLNERQWQNLIQHLMDNGMEIIEVGTDVSIEGQFMELLESFCTDLAQASVKEEILLGKPWNHENSSYFRLKDLKDYLIKHRFTEMDTNKIAARLRDIGAQRHFWNIRKRGCNIWEIPSFEYDEEPLVVPEMQQEEF